jgi:hypothetical protein
MRRTADPDLWCPQLEWLHRCADSALGQRGTLAAVVAAIERGGASGSGTFSHDAMLRTIGWRDDQPPIARELGNVQRLRRLQARWRELPLIFARIAGVHYLPRNSRDRVEQLLGFCAGVAVYLAPDRRRLLRACERPSEGGAAQVRDHARVEAETAVRALHVAWYATGQAEAARWADGA